MLRFVYNQFVYNQTKQLSVYISFGEDWQFDLCISHPPSG